MPLTAEQIKNGIKEFDDWFNKVSIPRDKWISEENYNDHRCFMLKGWLARQETLCVELPEASEFASKACSFKELLAFNLGVTVTSSRIEAAGIAHK